MGMLSAIGWISAAGHAAFRRDRAIHARGKVLSLSLSFGEKGKRMTSLFSISGADLSFRSVRYFCTVILEVFQKEKEEKDARGLDKRACPSFLKDGR